MAESEDISVSELDNMRASELRSRRVITLRDPENLTPQHLEKLKNRVNGLDKSQAIDLSAVNLMLENIPEAAATRYGAVHDLSPPSNVGDAHRTESWLQMMLRREHKCYHALIEDGGRPSHRPDDSGFEYLYEPQTNIVAYWITVCCNREGIFSAQRSHWDDFRTYQDWQRQRYWKPEWFNGLVEEVKEYRKTKGLRGDVSLLLDRKAQNALEDWVEYQYWEHGEADRLTKERDHFIEQQEDQESKLQTAILEGWPADEVAMIQDHTLALMRGRRGTAETKLQMQEKLLKWVNEQLPLVAEECGLTLVQLDGVVRQHSPARSLQLGKRKQASIDDPTGSRKSAKTRPIDSRLMLDDVHIADPMFNSTSESDIQAPGLVPSATKADARPSRPRRSGRHQSELAGLRASSKPSRVSRSIPRNCIRLSSEPITSTRVRDSRISKQAQPSATQTAVARGQAPSSSRRSRRKPQDRAEDAVSPSAEVVPRRTEDHSSLHDTCRSRTPPPRRKVGARGRKQNSAAVQTLRRSKRIAQRPVVHYPR